MKYLLITPVNSMSSYVIFPGIPTLLGLLERDNVECEYINLEAKYSESITIEDIISHGKILKTFFNEHQASLYPKIYSHTFETLEKKFPKQLNWWKNNIDNFNDFKKIYKQKNLLFNPFNIFYVFNFKIYIKELNLLFECGNNYYEDEPEEINIDDILFIINSPLNTLKDFYKQEIEKIIEKNPDVVGVQITTPTDFLTSLSFCYELKKAKPDIHINIGGNYFEEYYDRITNLKDFFGLFFDSVSIGESTNTVTDLVKYLKNEIPIEDVNNLLYLKDDELKYNKNIKEPVKKDLPFQSFTGYKKENYFLPDMVLPLRASTTTNSCYWGKCVYCACSDSVEKYSVLSPERFVDEIEFLSKKYNTRYFMMWDNALSPAYMEKVADIIISRKLKVTYNFYARLEKEFTYDILKKIKKSGCVAIHWGLDTAVPRLLKVINKGTDFDYAKQVLKTASDVGLYNMVYMIFGLPTETIEDLEANLKFVKENKRYLDFVNTIENVLFLNNSILYKEQEYYQSLINTDEKYIKRKKEVIEEIKKITYYVFTLDLLAQWQYMYLAKYGKFCNLIFRKLYYMFYSKQNKFVAFIHSVYRNIQIFIAKKKIK